MAVPPGESGRKAKLDFSAQNPNILGLMQVGGPVLRSVNEVEPTDRKPKERSPSRTALEERLRDFVYKESAAWREISMRYGDELTQSELLCIAKVIGTNLGIIVDREAKRRKNVLIKWFDENLEVILPFFERIRLIGSDGCPIARRPTQGRGN